jgi:hypothetical protein
MIKALDALVREEGAPFKSSQAPCASGVQCSPTASVYSYLVMLHRAATQISKYGIKRE